MVLYFSNRHAFYRPNSRAHYLGVLERISTTPHGVCTALEPDAFVAKTCSILNTAAFWLRGLGSQLRTSPRVGLLRYALAQVACLLLAWLAGACVDSDLEPEEPDTKNSSDSTTPETSSGNLSSELPSYQHADLSLAFLSINNNYFSFASGPENKKRWGFHLGRSNSFPEAYKIPLAARLDDSTFDCPGIFDLNSGEFEFLNSDGDTINRSIPKQNGLPIVGDWNGDGIDQLGLLSLATSSFYLSEHEIASDSQDAIELTISESLVEEFQDSIPFPVAGDWNGNGSESPALFSASNQAWYFFESKDVEPSVNKVPARYEAIHVEAEENAYPFAGDWNGDSVDDVGLYLPEKHSLLLFLGPIQDGKFTHGTQEKLEQVEASWPWLPVAGQWDPHMSTQPVYQGDSSYDWPTAQASDHRIDEQRLQESLNFADSLELIHSLLVIKDGKLITENYYRGYGPNIAHNIKSASKSILSTLVGLAIQEGAIENTEQKVAELIPDFFEELSQDKQGITLSHLLTMSAGLAWNENGDIDASVTNGDTWVRDILAQELETAPGTAFNYSSGLTHLTSRILVESTGEDLQSFAHRVLFEKLGIQAPRWDRDPEGLSIGGWDLWLTPRDLARFGQLFLDKGTIDGQSIVHPDWVRESTRPLVDLSTVYPEELRRPLADELGYGRWWWTGTLANEQVYMALGYGGQYLYVFPELELIIVTTSDYWNDRSPSEDGTSYDLQLRQLAERILEAVEK